MRLRRRDEASKETTLGRRPIAVGLAAAYTLAIVALTIAGVESARPVDAANTDEPSALERLTSPLRYLRSLVQPAAIEQLSIDVQFRFMHRIHEKRAEALRTGILAGSDEDLVEATIAIAGRVVPVRLRLAGEVDAGLAGEKWPMRVETEAGHYVLGMRRFTLLDPAAHGFESERLATEHLRSLGVVTPRSRFVRLTINGKQLGTMLLREHYAKEMLESQRRRDGVILRFDDDAFRATEPAWGSGANFDNPRIAPLRAQGAGRVRRSKALSAQRDTATALVERFLSGDVQAREVFDLELVAAYLAAAELWRSDSALRWDNLRFYYNPVSSRLEPVGVPFLPHQPRQEPGLIAATAPVSSRMLADPDLRARFTAAAHRLSEEVLEGDLLDRLAAIEAEDLRAIQRDYPWRVPQRRAALSARAEELRALSEAEISRFGAESARANPVDARLLRTPEGFALSLRNRLPIAIVVTALTSRRGDDPERDLAAARGLALPIRLAPTPLGESPSVHRLGWTSTERKRPRVAGIARLETTSETFAFRARKATPPIEANPVSHPSLDEALARHPFLRVVEGQRLLTTAPGGYEVTGSLVVPEGYGLSLPAGTELRFTAGEGLIARGPLLFRGSEESPVVLTGPVRKGADARWAGVAVLESAEESVWTHVHVHHAGAFSRDGWRPTGAILFRRAAIRMEHCRILDTHAEDAINLVRSRFSLREVEIEGARSDALDADFSDGRIEGGALRNIGGDGIDLSGARVEIEGVALHEIVDKAVSVGEASRVVALRLDIRSVGTAFVSKDLSFGEIRDSTIREVAHVALMAYVKKPVFGPAELVAEDNELHDVGSEALAQTGSRVFIDGASVPQQDIDIAQLYRDGYMRK